jgi:hypothetical protein
MNAIRNAIMSGERPKRPMQAGAVGLSGQLWEYITNAWHEKPDRRPRLSEIRDCLTIVDCAVPFLKWPIRTNSFTGESCCQRL